MAITREDFWKARSPRMNREGFAIDSEGNTIKTPANDEEWENFMEKQLYFPASRLIHLDKLLSPEEEEKKARGRKLLNGVSFSNFFTGEEGKSFPAGTPYDGDFEQALKEVGASPSEEIFLYADGDTPEAIEKDIRKAIKNVDMDRAVRKAFKDVKKKKKDILDGISGNLYDDNDDDNDDDENEEENWRFYD